MLRSIRTLSLFILGLIVLACSKPAIAQEQNRKFEVFAIAGTGTLKSGLASAEHEVDFGQDSSRGSANFGGAFGFRPISQLGIEFEAFGIGSHSLSAKKEIGREQLEMEKDYTGYSISINPVVHLYRFEGTHNMSFEPYAVGGLGVFHLESTTTETLSRYRCVFIICGFSPIPGERDIIGSTTNEFAANIGFGAKAYLVSWFSLRPEYKYLRSSSVRLHRLSIALGFHW